MRKIRIGYMCFLATMMVALLIGCGQETITLPGVLSVTPAQGATSVAINTTVTATFSMAMNSASITAANTFVLAGPGGTSVAGSVTYSGTTATFTPTAALAYGTTYTATISTAAAAPGGAELIGPYSWSFTTIAASVPSVLSVTPLPFATNVAIAAPITATFSQAMNPVTTDAAFTVKLPGGALVPGVATLSTNGLVATFTPTGGALAYNTTYTAMIANTATSLSEGIPLAANYTWTFTTITPPPTVTEVPVNGAIGVPVTQVITATFSEPMNCATLSSPATTFTLAGPGPTNVTGVVACSGNVATFTPGSLSYNTLYQATITTGAQDPAGQSIPFTQWSFLTAPAPVPLPTVISTFPATVAAPPYPIIPASSSISATFSEAMTPDTLNSATFLLVPTLGGTAINGVIVYDAGSDTATFAPIGGLAYNTEYTATITTGAEDLVGGGLAANYSWNFTTGNPLTPAPTVTSTNPVTPNPPGVPEDVTVPVNQVVTATFSEAMNPATIVAANFTLTPTVGPAVTGLVSYSAVSDELVFIPSANLLPSTTYTANITTGVQDLAGQPLAAAYSWIFMTGTATNGTPPELEVVVPANGATGVPINQAVSATFSEAMNGLTITSSTFLLYPGTSATGTPIAGTYQYNPVTFIATFTPTDPLAISSSYTATVTNGATNLAGVGLGNTGPILNNTWTFTTGTTANAAPVLGPTIAAFGGFTGSAGMTNTGTLTVIHGDAGTTATGFSSFTGFHDDTVLVGGVPQCQYTETGSNIGLVTGTIYSPLVVPAPYACPEGTAADIAVADQALAEANTDYTYLQGLPSTGVLAAELGSTTIYPGVYKNASSVGITAGDLTLDAQGDPNAYWVFQIGTTLTVGQAAVPSNIILANGAQAKNIYWAVGTDVPHLEQAGGGTFNGTVIAYGSVGIAVSTVGNTTITTVNGRLISLNASTTLVDTVINVPAP